MTETEQVTERDSIDGATFSAAVAVPAAGRTIYVSGKTADGPDLASQAESAFDQIAQDLERFGGSLSDVVRITAYLTSFDDYADTLRIRGERFGQNLPASATVGVAALIGGALIEIDAVAVLTG